MKFKILIVALLFSCFSFGQIAAWDFTGVGATSLPTHAASVYNVNMDASNLVSRGASATWSTGTNAFRTVGFQNNGIATTNTDYFQVTLSATAGNTLSLSTIDANFAGTATFAASPGVSNQFAYSLDGTTFTLIATPQILIGSPATLAQIDLSGISALQNVPEATTVTLRFYASGQTTTGGWGFNSPVAGAYGLAIGGSVNPAGPCTVPLNQASAATFSNPTTNGATISWANGASTSGSMVVIRPTSALVLDPSTSTSYTPNANYATAGQIDVDNRVVYLGGATSVNVTGLNPETQYTATIYSYNALDCYNTTAPVSVNFYTLSTEPTAQPTAGSFTCAVGTPNTSVINLTFPAANTLGGDGYIILYRIGAAPTGVPTDGAFHAPGTVFGDAIVLGQTANTGTTTTFAATGLNSGSIYHFSLVPFNGFSSVAGTLNYRTAATILTTSCTTAAATPFITLANNGTQVTAANVPQGTTDLILHKFQLTVATANATLQGITATTNGTYVAGDLVNLKVRYSANNVLDVTDATLSTKTLTLGPGAQVFPSFTSQIITAGTIGYIFITADISATATLNNTIALNAIATTNVIFAAGTKTGTTNAGGTQTISPSAPAVPTSFTRVCTSNTTQSLTWAAPATGTFDGYLLVVRDGATPHAVTTIVASSQTFNSDYSLAPTYNATTSRVLYVGTGTSATITGLTPGVSYTYALYAYKNNGASSVFSATATTITQITAVPNVTGFGSSPANTSGTITWANPNAICFDEILVVATTAAGITFAPSGNGSTYVPNTVYAGNNSIVFNNAGNFVTVTGLTNGVTYYFEIFVRTGTQWSSGVEVSVTPNSSTVFKPGELMFVGFDGQVFSTGAADQYMVATMVDILPGTTFSLANSRYEAGAPANVRTNKWGGAGNDPSATPGVTNFTYNGAAVITAGSVLVLNTNSAPSPIFDYVGVITGTTLVDRTTDFVMTQSFGIGTSPNISTTSGDGEQIYLLQGNFVSDGIIDLNEANYILNGTLLHGFTIKTGWVPLTSACSGVNGGGSNRQSRLPSALDCFNVESAVANTISGFYENSAQHGPTSLRNIIREIANVSANWTLSNGRYTVDASINMVNRAGRTFTISAGETAGQWVGDVDTNWFNCANWGRLSVPDETVDVVIDNVVSINNAVINHLAPFSDLYTDIAACNNITVSGRRLFIEAATNNILEVYGDLTIASTGVLDMNDGNNVTADGTIRLYGDWINNVGLTAFDEGNGTVEFLGSVPQVINNNVHTNTEEFFNVILDNDFDTVLSNNLIATGNLNVLANNLVNIRDNDYIQVNRNLTNNGSLEIDNNGILYQVDDSGVNQGNIVMRRNASIRQLDYVFWSSPIDQFVVNNISPATPSNVIWKWNPRIANPNGAFGNWENCATETMLRGKGYIVRGPSGHSTATPSNFTATFQNAIANAARPNNGVITQRLHRGPMVAANLGTYTSANTVAFSINDDNWNLVGNPYPSAISALSFLTYNAVTVPVIEGSVRIWTHNTLPISNINPFYNSYQYNYTANDYITHNGTATISGPTGFNGFIGAGQGFFVLMNDGAQTNDADAPINLVFNNAMRVKTTNSNSQFYRSANATVVATEEKHRIWLDLIGSTGNVVRTVVGYVPNATNEKDVMFDAYARLDGNSNFYSLIDNEKVCIQGRPVPFNDSDLVPLGAAIASAGTYKIAIAYVDGLFEANQDIYVEDKMLNVIHDLRTAPYTFTSTTGVFNDRFVLRYTNASLNTASTELNPNIVITTQNQQVSIKSDLVQMKSVVIYDMLGRTLLNREGIYSNDVVLSNINASNQALVVKITLENGQVISKKIIL